MYYMPPFMQPYQYPGGVSQPGYMPAFGQAQQFPNQAFFQSQQQFQYMAQQNLMQQQNPAMVPTGETPAYNFMQVNNRMGGYQGPQLVDQQQQQNMSQVLSQPEAVATTSTNQVKRKPGPKCKQQNDQPAEQIPIPPFQQLQPQFLQQPMMMPFNYPYGMYPMPPQQMQMGQSPSPQQQQQQQPQMLLFYAPAPPNQSDTMVIPSIEQIARTVSTFFL
jgi:hypothetical protein